MATPRLVPPAASPAVPRWAAAVVPDLAAGAGIERVAFVGGGDVHDAADHDGVPCSGRRWAAVNIHFGRRRDDLALVIWESVV